MALRLGITRQTLHNWVAKHQLGGTQALVAKPRGRARRKMIEPTYAGAMLGRVAGMALFLYC